MIVYDITDKKTFDRVTNWVNSIEEKANAYTVKVLVGNKSDLED